MNSEINKLILQNEKLLDDKNEQTTYKIKYVTSYVKNWLRVMSNAKYTQNLNFIDCMCNAGIYKDGDFCTAVCVLKMFKDFAESFPNKNYCLYINDKSCERLKVFKDIVELIFDNKLPENIKLYSNNEDVNNYINILTTNDSLFSYPNATILFVDPYDFGTVHIPTLRRFAEKYYCEIIFNVFTSDFVRNKMDKRIKTAIDNEQINIKTKEELVNYIISQLKVNKMQYSFQYEFRIATNVELYQIMFLTPSPKGLDELKNALWDTFKGLSFHRNHKQTNDTMLQMSMFSENDEIEERLRHYVNEAKSLLKHNYKNTELSYKQICDIILPVTMLKSTHIINALLKPAIEGGEILKLNRTTIKTNYKDDFYKIM